MLIGGTSPFVCAVCELVRQVPATSPSVCADLNEFQGKVVGITGREETNGFRKLFSFREVRFVYVFSSPTSAKFAAEKTRQFVAENNPASRMSRNSVGCRQMFSFQFHAL